MKTITITRLWHRPEIEITVNNELISLKMNAEDFRKALIEEIGSVKFVFRQKTFDKIVSAAFERVISGIKAESAKVVHS